MVIPFIEQWNKEENLGYHTFHFIVEKPTVILLLENPVTFLAGKKFKLLISNQRNWYKWGKNQVQVVHDDEQQETEKTNNKNQS